MNALVQVFRELCCDELFFDELMHGMAMAPFALLLYRKIKSVKLAMFVFVAGYLIDLDHLVDYFALYGSRFDLVEFWKGECFEITQKAYIPLHAWEWLVVLGLISRKVGWKSYITALTLGFAAHMVYDFMVVGDFFFYSIIYRTLVINFGYLWLF